jgi:hypothetical protein
LPERDVPRYRAVGDKFTVAPGGKTVGQLAEEHGWSSGPAG